jgi:hypothetical protein
MRLAAGLGVMLAACSPAAPNVVVVAAEIASPAGEGSGEPFLSFAGDTIYLSWLEATERGHELRFSRYRDGAWDEPLVIAAGRPFFVNWADFPSVVPGPGGALWAHWLERGTHGGYDYGIRIVRSDDHGRTWSQPWTPHEDDTPTEHGFVSTVAIGGEVGFLWLDGRQLARGRDGAPPTDEMALYFRTASPSGHPGPETLVDARVCDCCQTDLAATSAGPVAVYRDRSAGEIRDIYVTRLVDGAWTDGVPVHEDGWETAACPVNGPSVTARDARVAVAWFTAAAGTPRVKVAFSRDAGARFSRPVVVDGGNPAGRADVLMLEDGGVLVSWIERTGGEAAEVRVRYVAPDGRLGESASVTPSTAERASGFPRLVRDTEGTILAAWTDAASMAPKVRVARLTVGRVP